MAHDIVNNPFTETFSAYSDGQPVVRSDNFTSISTIYTQLGEFDDASAMTTGTVPPSGGIAMKGITGNDLGVPVTIGTMDVAIDGTYGVTTEWYFYLDPIWDPRIVDDGGSGQQVGAGLQSFKFLIFGDTSSRIMGRDIWNVWDITWTPEYETNGPSWTIVYWSYPQLYVYNPNSVEELAPRYHPYYSPWLTTKEGEAIPVPCLQTIPFGEWVKARIYHKFDSAQHEGDGIIRIWINNVLNFETTNCVLRRTVGDGATHWVRMFYHLKTYPYDYPNSAPFWIDDVSMIGDAAATAPPVPTVVVPRSGPLSGFNEVKIYGSNLTNVSAVAFDGVWATHLVIDSDTEITCKAPAGRADSTVVDIQAISGDLIGTITAGYEYKDVTSGFSDDLTVDPIAPANWTELNNTTGDLKHDGASEWYLVGAADSTRPLSGEHAAALYTGAEDTESKIVLYGTRDQLSSYHQIMVLKRASGASFDALEGFAVMLQGPGTGYQWLVAGHFDGAGGNWHQKSLVNLTLSALPLSYRLEVTMQGSQNVFMSVVDNSQANTVLTNSWYYGFSEGYTGKSGFGFMGAGSPTSSYTDSSQNRVDRVIIVDANTVTSAPTVTGASPAVGTIAGGTEVTVTGTGFVDGATVDFGFPDDWSAAAVVFVSSTELTCTTAARVAGPVAIKVTNPNGLYDYRLGTYLYQYTVPSVTVTSIAPASGTTTGGTTVDIVGQYFYQNCSVFFGTTPVSPSDIQLLGSGFLRVITPAHAAGVVDITVTNEDLSTDTLEDAFTYVAPTGATKTLELLIRGRITLGLNEVGGFEFE